MNYNQIITETSRTCLETNNFGICEQWIETTIKTINYFDLIILGFIILIPFLVVFFIFKK